MENFFQFDERNELKQRGNEKQDKEKQQIEGNEKNRNI